MTTISRRVPPASIARRRSPAPIRLTVDDPADPSGGGVGAVDHAQRRAIRSHAGAPGGAAGSACSRGRACRRPIRGCAPAPGGAPSSARGVSASPSSTISTRSGATSLSTTIPGLASLIAWTYSPLARVPSVLRTATRALRVAAAAACAPGRDDPDDRDVEALPCDVERRRRRRVARDHDELGVHRRRACAMMSSARPRTCACERGP